VAPAPEPPPSLLCPISFKLLLNAVGTSTGHSFDEDAIWLYLATPPATDGLKPGEAARKYVCPLTKQKAWLNQIGPNYNLRQLAEDWAKANPAYEP
jgi:hypothetical protein